MNISKINRDIDNATGIQVFLQPRQVLSAIAKVDQSARFSFVFLSVFRIPI